VRLRAEKEALGFFLTGNPLLEYQSQIARLTTHTTRTAREGFSGTATVGGLVTRVKRVKIKSGANAGKVMARFVLEDQHGGLAATAFVEALRKYEHLLVEDSAVIAKGTVRERGGEVEMMLEEVVPLDRAAVRLISEVQVDLAPGLPKRTLLALRDLLTEHPGGAAVVFSIRIDGDRAVRIEPEERFRIDYSPELVTKIEALVGAGTVAAHQG